MNKNHGEVLLPGGAESRGRVSRALRHVGLWISVVLIAAVGALSYFNIRDLIDERSAVEQTQTVLREIELLTSHVKDAETGQRGFLITGNDDFLGPYRSAVLAVPGSIARLRGLLAAQPDQARRLADIDELQRKIMSLLATGIEARRTAGVAAADPERMTEGRANMDRFRAVAAEMAEAETRRLHASDSAADRRATFTLMALGFGVFASIAIIVVVFYRVQVESERRRQAESDTRALNADLESRVEARTRELEREVAERRDVETQLRAIMNEAPFAIIAVDSEKRLTVWSKGAEEIFGYMAAEALGRSWVDLLVPVENREMHERVWKGLPAGTRLRGLPAKRQHKSGKIVEVVVSASGLFDSDGTFQGAVGIFEDMTEKRSLERQVRQAQRMEAVGQLTGGIAHDFNNILSIVIGNLDLLADRLGDKGKERDLADAAMKGALRGAELVQRLLAFARRKPMAPQAIDLNARLPAMAALLRRALGEHIAIQTVPGAGLWPALADPAQLEDAILNLAINARDAMPGGGTLTIETAPVGLDAAYAAANPEAIPGDYAMLAVSDTGTGMPPEVAEKAFEPFFTTKETGKGTGLGLSMVYGFVKQLGGHVKIYSEMGHGTSVKLYLPRSNMVAEPADAPAPPAGTMPRGTERVLVVEDNPGVREAAIKTLADLGYRVHAVASGPAALAWLDRGDPVDLLFTDIVMPDSMNGRELAVEALRRRPALKVLFTTGYAEAAMQNGLGTASFLIGKPYRKAELARMLRRAIDGNGNGGASRNGGK